jgi:hypothetical protein
VIAASAVNRKLMNLEITLQVKLERFLLPFTAERLMFCCPEI